MSLQSDNSSQRKVTTLPWWVKKELNSENLNNFSEKRTFQILFKIWLDVRCTDVTITRVFLNTSRLWENASLRNRELSKKRGKWHCRTPKGMLLSTSFVAHYSVSSYRWVFDGPPRVLCKGFDILKLRVSVHSRKIEVYFAGRIFPQNVWNASHENKHPQKNESKHQWSARAGSGPHIDSN